MTRILADFVAGALCLLRGLRLLAVPALRPFVLVPLAVNIILFSAAIGVGAWYFGTLLQEWLPQGNPSWLPQWLSWLSFLVELLAWLLWAIFALIAALLVFFTFSLVANLIAAPFNDQLAAAVERYLGGTLKEGERISMKQAAAEALAAIFSELRKMLYFALWAIPVLLVQWIPGAQILWLAYGAWMLALEYVDCPLSNHGLLFPQQRELLRRHRAEGLGFGSAVMVLTMLPLFNFIAMPAGVAGATILWWERLRTEQGTSE